MFFARIGDGDVEISTPELKGCNPRSKSRNFIRLGGFLQPGGEELSLRPDQDKNHETYR
jgi:hypothetical protein